MSVRSEGSTGRARENEGAFAGAPVTLVIILANLAIFAAEVLTSRGLESLVSMPNDVSLLFGANYEPLTLGLHQYDRLVASCFLHGNLLHVGMNMWALRQIGPFAERTVGSARYAVLYVVTGIAGSIASAIWPLLTERPLFPSVGASGAICGVMGAAFVLGVRLEGWRSGIAGQIGFWLLVTLLYGAKALNVDNAAHVGGIALGCLIAALWRRGIRYSTTATIVSIGVSAAVCLTAGVTVVWRDVTDPDAAQFGPGERITRANDALKAGDCVEARRWLRAAEAVSTRVPGPDLEGTRMGLDQKCPPRR
jgi:rhomboid protease GluP